MTSRESDIEGCNYNVVKSLKYQYCGKHKCRFVNDAELSDSCDSYDLKGAPSGYSHHSYIGSVEDSYCGAFTKFDDGKVRKVVWDLNKLSKWDPLMKAVLETPQGSMWYEWNMNKVLDCCAGKKDGSSTDMKECGSYRCPKICNVTTANYCLDSRYPNRMLKAPCQKYCADNPTKCKAHLKSICADKMGKPAWDEICSCHYPSSVYQNIANEINEKWSIPPNLISTTPECIHNRCKSSALRDKNATCPSVNLAKCVQNIELGLSGDVDISNIELNQSQECGVYKEKEDPTVVYPDPDVDKSISYREKTTIAIREKSTQLAAATGGKISDDTARILIIVLIALISVIILSLGGYGIMKLVKLVKLRLSKSQLDDNIAPGRKHVSI
jgi:hypothetical protein